jgi:protein-S-isoprenylcysteine O-methyltransferase Ste14
MKRIRLPEPAVEVSLRVSTALAGMFFVHAGWVQWHMAPSRWTLPLIMVGEIITVLLLLASNVPQRRDWRPASFICTIVASYYFLAVRLTPGLHLAPELVGSLIQTAGLFWAVFAKLSLRRSFGLLPANRGVMTGGAYRFMRHPMYVGYFVSHMGFLLVNFGWQNLVVFTVLYSVQAWRVLREEEMLLLDPVYRAYAQQVRYRVLPGVF